MKRPALPLRLRLRPSLRLSLLLSTSALLPVSGTAHAADCPVDVANRMYQALYVAANAKTCSRAFTLLNQLQTLADKSPPRCVLHQVMEGSVAPFTPNWTRTICAEHAGFTDSAESDMPARRGQPAPQNAGSDADDGTSGEAASKLPSPEQLKRLQAAYEN